VRFASGVVIALIATAVLIYLAHLRRQLVVAKPTLDDLVFSIDFDAITPEQAWDIWSRDLRITKLSRQFTPGYLLARQRAAQLARGMLAAGVGVAAGLLVVASSFYVRGPPQSRR
jgi:hypothetical protein